MSVVFLNKKLHFPPPEQANEDGLLAIGGDLSPSRLLLAYSKGIFPWFNEYDPILWWSPNPRFVLYPEDLKVSRSMRNILNRKKFRVTYDEDFQSVIKGCKEVYREGQGGTWITDEVEGAYYKLHRLGFAHSVEVWEADELVGGLYGVSLGSCFFGESMFTKASNASKAGFITLVADLIERGCTMIDCQLHTHHLERFGAIDISREHFLEELGRSLNANTLKGSWSSWRSSKV